MKVFKILTLLCLTGLISHTVQAQPPSLGPAKAIGVDLANTPLNRPSPDQKSYTYWKPETADGFFPSLLGLRTAGAQMIRTRYFNIYFSTAEKTARHIADFCDEVLSNLMRHYPTFVDRIAPIHVVVDDQADYLGNAFAVYSANYIHFWTNPIDWEIRGTSDWVRNVFVHELAHIVTLKAAYKGLPFQIGIVNASRANENPDFSFTLGLYHLAVNSGFAEGISQYEATEYGDDRWDTHRDMLLRMAALENDLLSLPSMGQLGGKGNFHGEMVYNQGYAMLNYIGERFSPTVVRQIFEHRPIINFNSSLKKATGVSAKQLYRDWKAHIEERYSAVQSDIQEAGEREGELIVDRGNLDYHPVYSPQGDKLGFISNDDSDYFITELKVMDLTTKKVTKIADRVDNRFVWTASGDSLMYIKAVGARWDIFTYDTKTKKETRVTVGLRGKDPTLSPDGKQIAFVTMRDGTANIGLVNTDGTDVRYLTNNNDATQYFGPKWSPDGKHLLFSIFRTGEDRDIAIIDVNATTWEKKKGRRSLEKKEVDTQLDSLQQAKADSLKAFPDSLAYANNANFKAIVHSTADERDPVWLPDGSGFVFSSDRTGIFNLYTHDMATGEQKQLTNVVGGAFLPTISPDAKDVIYAGYHAANYNLYRIPLSEAVAVDPPEGIARDYAEIYTGKSITDLHDIGRYSTRLVSYGITPIALLGPTFIGNRFGLDQISAGVQWAWGDLLGSDVFVTTALIGKNFRRQQDFNSEFAFYYQNSLTPILSEQSTYVPRIFFGGSRQTINSIVDLGTVQTVRDTLTGTLITQNDEGQQVLIPNVTQHLDLTVTEEDDFKDVFSDFTVGAEMGVGRGHYFSLAYGYRKYSENLHAVQVLHDSSRVFQTNLGTGEVEDITDQIPGPGYASQETLLDDFLYKELDFFKSNEWMGGWSYITLKPATDLYINPSGGRALSFRYRRINATVIDSLARTPDLNEDFVPDPIGEDLSPAFFRGDKVNVGFNEYIASFNEFIPLVGRSTLALQVFGAYKDSYVKEVQQEGGTFEGVFYYPLRYYLGGLGTLRGYPYFTIAGGKALFGRTTLTLPIFKHIGAELPPLFFDKVYASLFFEFGGVSNAASIGDIFDVNEEVHSGRWDKFKDSFLFDYGAEIRFQVFSHYRLPMFGYFIVARPTKLEVPSRNNPDIIEEVSGMRFYFGLSL